MVDATENLRKIRVAVDGNWYDSIAEAAKMKSGFAISGAGLFFVYAIFNRKPNWMWWTFWGLILGGALGYAVTPFLVEEKSLVVE